MMKLLLEFLKWCTIAELQVSDDLVLIHRNLDAFPDKIDGPPESRLVHNALQERKDKFYEFLDELENACAAVHDWKGEEETKKKIRKVSPQSPIPRTNNSNNDKGENVTPLVSPSVSSSSSLISSPVSVVSSPAVSSSPPSPPPEVVPTPSPLVAVPSINTAPIHASLNSPENTTNTFPSPRKSSGVLGNDIDESETRDAMKNPHSMQAQAANWKYDNDETTSSKSKNVSANSDDNSGGKEITVAHFPYVQKPVPSPDDTLLSVMNNDKFTSFLQKRRISIKVSNSEISSTDLSSDMVERAFAKELFRLQIPVKEGGAVDRLLQKMKGRSVQENRVMLLKLSMSLGTHTKNTQDLDGLAEISGNLRRCASKLRDFDKHLLELRRKLHDKWTSVKFESLNEKDNNKITHITALENDIGSFHSSPQLLEREAEKNEAVLKKPNQLQLLATAVRRALLHVHF